MSNVISFSGNEKVAAKMGLQPHAISETNKQKECKVQLSARGQVLVEWSGTDRQAVWETACTYAVEHGFYKRVNENQISPEGAFLKQVA